MTRKTWIIFAALVVVLLGGLVYLSAKNQIDVSNVSKNALTGNGPISDVQIKASDQNGNIGDHIFGNKNAKVTLVEYGDFQCPGCGAAYPALKAVSEKYSGQIAFVFRNFPLVTIHPNALAAATAAEAAGQMGKYWEMHNLLYDNQNSWVNLSASQRTSAFVSYASQLGLNTNEFKQKMDSDAVSKKISFDRALGTRLNISGTPSVYFDGKSVNQQVTKDGKLTSTYDSSLSYVWADEEAMDKLIIQPALKEHGIALPTSSKK